MNNNQLQERIISQWKSFSGTEAYKDWIQSMNEYTEMLQKNVDNMVEPRPVASNNGKVITESTPITAEKAMLLNQRKVGAKYAIQYTDLRVNA